MSSPYSQLGGGISLRCGENLLEIAANGGATDTEVASEFRLESPAQALASDMLQDGAPPQPGA
jgi:hypothetical protein